MRVKVVVAVLLPFFFTAMVNAGPVVWRVFSDPTWGADVPHGVVLMNDNMYFYGLDGNGARIEVRSKVGDLLKTWSSQKYYAILSCSPLEGKLLCSVGDYLLLFDGNLNLLREERLNHLVADVVYRGGYVYATGAKVTSSGDFEWIVEKRTPDLRVVARYESNPTSENDWAIYVEVNPSTGDVWVAGGYYNYNRWRLVILDSNLRELKDLRKPDLKAAYSMAFDEEGNAYGATESNIVKFDKRGNEVKRLDTDIYIGRLFYASGLLYVAGHKEVDGYWRHVLKVYDKNLNKVHEIVLSQDVKRHSKFWYLGRVAFDGKHLYLAGYDFAENNTWNLRWVLYGVRVAASVNFSSNAPVSLPSGVYPLGYRLRVEVPGFIEVSPGRRLVFKRWEGLNATGTALELTVDRDLDVKAVYAAMCLVEAETPVGRVFVGGSYGSAWLEEGSIAVVQVDRLEEGFLVRKVFDHWEGLKEYDSVLGPGKAGVVVVDGPRQLKAVYRDDYTQLVALLAALAMVTFAVSTFRKSWTAGEGTMPVSAEDMEAELKKYKGYLERLEELRRRGEVSDEVYRALREEYEGKIKELEEKYRSRRKRLLIT